MPRATRHTNKFWQTQLPIDHIADPLVQNVWETIIANLSGGDPAKLWYILITQTNNGAAVEDIELEITINGTAYVFARAAAVSATEYNGTVSEILTGGDFTTAFALNDVTVVGLDPDQAVPFIARTISLIRVRQTTPVDVTAAQIEVNIVWEKFVNV